MDEPERSERLRAARYRQRAQRARRSRLQSRVVVASLACFALLWGIVFTQMATGNDPVLGSGRHGKPAASAPPHERPARPAAEEEAVPAEEDAAPIEEEADPAEEEAVPIEEELPAEGAVPAEEEAFAPEPEPVVTGQS